LLLRCFFHEQLCLAAPTASYDMRPVLSSHRGIAQRIDYRQERGNYEQHEFTGRDEL
jgi:hypothetical protein